ncbi:MAG: acetylxylan esterase [Bacteroidales bacterium]|nr:acetylxylan esterase [Bacteroidales bacterium]
MNNRFIVCLMVVVICLASCERNDDEDNFEPEIPNKYILENIITNDASLIGFNSFQANWSRIDSAEFYELELSKQSNFNTIDSIIGITDSKVNYYQFRSLKPDSVYYYRIRYFKDDSCSNYSNIIRVQVNRENINISYLTHDNILLKGRIHKKVNIEERTPAVIFIHEAMSDKNEWINHEFFKRYVDSGFVSFAFDVTGHGESGGIIDFPKFRIDTNILPKDFKVSLKYLQSLDYVDQNRIGVYGGSMGAFMGVGASAFSEIKAVVALTCPYQHIVNLYDITNINSVFYIAGELDGDFPGDAQKLYNITKGPKKIEIVEGSSYHGVTLLYTSTELKNEAFNWIYNSLEF